MAREKSPEGRRVPVSFKLTDAEAGLVDAARGALERGPWMRQAALEAAKGNTGTAKPDTGIPGTPRGTRQRDPKTCKHKGLRLAKGVCPDCSTWAVRP